MDAEGFDSAGDVPNGWRPLPAETEKVPETALELGQSTLSKRTRIAAAKRDGAGVVWIDVADGPRAIDRSNTAPARNLLAKAAEYHRLNSSHSGNGGSPGTPG